jgi:hypothetical protein
MRVHPESVTHLVVKLFNVKSKFDYIDKNTHVTQKCVVLTFEYSKVSLETVNKPFYGFSQYMCNSVKFVSPFTDRPLKAAESKKIIAK